MTGNGGDWDPWGPGRKGNIISGITIYYFVVVVFFMVLFSAHEQSHSNSHVLGACWVI